MKRILIVFAVVVSIFTVALISHAIFGEHPHNLTISRCEAAELAMDSGKIEGREEDLNKDKKPYLLVYDPSEEEAEYVRIVGLISHLHADKYYNYHGKELKSAVYSTTSYGASLWAGFQEVKKKFEIIGKSIARVDCDGGVVRELWFAIEPKE